MIVNFTFTSVDTRDMIKKNCMLLKGEDNQTMSNTRTDIERIFHPSAISIIGSSNRKGSFGRLFLEGFIRMGFKEIYPVHPSEKELLGIKAYPNIKEIPVDIDLAISLVPRERSSQGDTGMC